MYYNNDFSHDLLVGNIAEEYLGSVLSEKKIEVKYDKIALETGRVFVEFECRGNPSGITTTEADFWAFVFMNSIIILISKQRLVALCNDAYNNNKMVNGGDNNASRGFLIDIEKLVRSNLCDSK
jgi:hypothetical protein